MKYTIKETKVEIKDLGPEAQMAIMIFKKRMKLEKKLADIEHTLNDWVRAIPKKDLDGYVKYTDQLHY